MNLLESIQQINMKNNSELSAIYVSESKTSNKLKNNSSSAADFFTSDRTIINLMLRMTCPLNLSLFKLRFH